MNADPNSSTRAACGPRYYSPSAERRGSFLCFGWRSSRVRLSTNFFDGRIGARSRGRSASFFIVSFLAFFGTTQLYNQLRRRRYKYAIHVLIRLYGYAGERR